MKDASVKAPMVEATHSEDQVKTYYSWRASNYDAGAGFEVEHHTEGLKLADIKQGQHLLDAACGTGRGTVGLAQAVGPSGIVEAFDISTAMLEQAQAKLSKLGLSSRVNFRAGSVRKLPYADNSFDAVYNGYMFDLIPLNGFLPILEEFKRVLKPGGKLVLVNMSKPGSKKSFYEKVYEKKLAVMPCRPVLMGPYLKEAGFADIKRIYRPTHGLIVSRLWGTEIVTAVKPA